MNSVSESSESSGAFVIGWMDFLADGMVGVCRGFFGGWTRAVEVVRSARVPILSSIDGIDFHQIASGVSMSSVPNVILMPSLSTSPENTSPTSIPRNLALYEVAARRFDTPLMKFEERVRRDRKEGEFRCEWPTHSKRIWTVTWDNEHHANNEQHQRAGYNKVYIYNTRDQNRSKQETDLLAAISECA